MKLATLAAAAALMVLPLGAAGLAQTAAPAAPAAAPMHMAPMHTEKSIECSRQADAKGLHGEARRKFRAACKKAP
jgi:hypothetical protein